MAGKIGRRPSFTYCRTAAAMRSRTVDSGVISICTGARLLSIVTFSSIFDGCLGKPSGKVAVAVPARLLIDGRSETVFGRRSWETDMTPWPWKDDDLPLRWLSIWPLRLLLGLGMELTSPEIKKYTKMKGEVGISEAGHRWDRVWLWCATVSFMVFFVVVVELNRRRCTPSGSNHLGGRCNSKRRERHRKGFEIWRVEVAFGANLYGQTEYNKGFFFLMI